RRYRRGPACSWYDGGSASQAAADRVLGRSPLEVGSDPAAPELADDREALPEPDAEPERRGDRHVDGRTPVLATSDVHEGPATEAHVGIDARERKGQLELALGNQHGGGTGLLPRPRPDQ